MLAWYLLNYRKIAAHYIVAALVAIFEFECKLVNRLFAEINEGEKSAEFTQKRATFIPEFHFSKEF